MGLDLELDALLADWEARREAGQAVTPEDVCRDRTHRLDDLRALIRRLQRLDDLLETTDQTTNDADRAGRLPPAGPLSVATRSRYRVSGFLARGGLGEVYLGWDEELQREVALKFLQDSAKADASRQARFLREASITAKLGHPGIVPLFGAGETDDGRPCYAMRFIEGESLHEAVVRYHRAEAGDPGPGAGERSLAFRNLIGRLATASHAISFAHSRGVIHRDLKPANIMLGPFQETLVVDWGLAKQVRVPSRRGVQADAGPQRDVPDELSEVSHLAPIESAIDPLTDSGAVLGTPGFMAPEQAEGRWDDVGTACDVYSLGATLYFILTGRPPFARGSLAEVLRDVRRGRFTPPREVNPTVPAALEAICLRAMATRPDDRYPDPRDLAADLERWLADEPVSARREPFLSRLARWGRRHKTSVAAVAALASTALVALAVSTVLLGREQRRTNAALVESRDNFRLARQAVDDYCTNISKELINEPGASGLRKRLFATARDYYERFLHTYGADPGLTFELGTANRRLGDLIAATESPTAAVPIYRRAVALLQTAVNEGSSGEVADRFHELGNTWDVLGTTYHEAEQFPAAVDAYRQAISALGEGLKRQPAHAKCLAEILSARSNLATALTHLDRGDEAKEQFLEVIAAGTELARNSQENAVVRRTVAAAHNNIALLCRARGQLPLAKEHLSRSLEIKEALLRDQPENKHNRYGLAVACVNLGELENDLKQADQAEVVLKRAVSLLEPLTTDFPTTVSYGGALVAAYQGLALALRQMKQWPEADAVLVRAIRVVDQLAEKYPTQAGYAFDAAATRADLGAVKLEEGDLRAALSLCDDALKTLESLAAPDAERLDVPKRLSQTKRTRDEAIAALDRLVPLDPFEP